MRSKLVLATLLVALLGAAGTGRLSGRVTDGSGAPVADLELRFVPEGKTFGEPRTLKSSKKGTFQHAFFPAGSYKVQLADGSRWIKSMLYVLKDGASGAEITREQGQGRPDRELPPIQLASAQFVELEIVVAGKDEAPPQAGGGPAVPVAAPATDALKGVADLLNAGDAKAAEERAAAALATQPDLADAHYLRGMALARLGKLPEAESSLRRAAELAPDHPGVDTALGVVLAGRAHEEKKAGHAEAARALYEESIPPLRRERARTPGSAQVLQNLAAALDGAGHSAELTEVLEALVAADPSNPAPPLRLAAAQLDAGKTDEALALLARAPGPKRGPARVLADAAATRFNDNRIDESIALARKAIELDPDYFMSYRVLARAAASKGDKATAIPALQKLLALGVNDAEIASDRQLLKALEESKNR